VARLLHRNIANVSAARLDFADSDLIDWTPWHLRRSTEREAAASDRVPFSITDRWPASI